MSFIVRLTIVYFQTLNYHVWITKKYELLCDTLRLPYSLCF